MSRHFSQTWKWRRETVKMGRWEKGFSSTSSCQWNPPPNCFFLVDERKSSSERRKSEKSQPARVVRVEQELHTHRHTDTLTHTHGKWRLDKGKAKHTKPKAKAKENPHPLRGKAIGKACAVRECCEIQRRRRRRQRRWQRSCDWCALWKMASIMRCATAVVVVVVFGACLLARHGANNKEYGKV